MADSRFREFDMRIFSLLGAVGAVMIGAVPVHAQTYPADLTIIAPEVEVRSGPTDKFYPTSKLRAGDRVTVIRQDASQRDWLAIKPPPGSFSWIKADFVDQTPQFAIVKSKDPVPVKPGSSLSNEAPVNQAMVSQGTMLTIAGPPRTAADGTWIMVQPPPTEVRFIPASAVRQAVAGAPPAVASPAATTTGTLASLSKGNMPGNPTTMNSGASYAGGQGWVPANAPGNSNYSPGALGSPSQATPNCNPPQWSVYGQLRRTAFQKDGQPMFVLENNQGQPLLYVTARPGFTLTPYIGKTLSMYGPISYHSDGALRRYYMTATSVYVVH
jgi:hypothetical protein